MDIFNLSTDNRLFKQLTSPQGSKVTIKYEDIISTYKFIVADKEECKEILKTILQQHINYLLKNGDKLQLPLQYRRTFNKINDLKDIYEERIAESLLEKYLSQEGFNIEEEIPSFYDFLVLRIFLHHIHSALEPKEESKFVVLPAVEIKDYRTRNTEFVSEITVDKNTRPDLNSTIGFLNHTDVFATCDKSQAVLLMFLYPKYKEKIQWYSQPPKS